MSETTDEFPALFVLLGGYFNQDWMVDAPNAESVLDEFVSHEPAGIVNAVRPEIERLLAKNPSEPEVAKALTSELGTSYFPSSGTYIEWLHWLSDTISRKLGQ